MNIWIKVEIHNPNPHTGFDKERPEVQICNWDAGWWQLKELWKVVAKEKLKELTQMRNELSVSIRSRTRTLG